MKVGIAFREVHEHLLIYAQIDDIYMGELLFVAF